MSLRNTETSYGSVSKFFHWVLFLLIATLLIVGFIMDDIADRPTRMTVYQIHKSVGLSVLILTLLRTTWRLTNPVPGYSSSTPRWEKFLAHTAHYGLYIVSIAMPISGWIMSTAAGHAPSYFGFGSFPFPAIPVSKPLAEQAGEAHEILAWMIIALVSLHLLAALKHHFYDRDNVLLRMIPFYKRS